MRKKIISVLAVIIIAVSIMTLNNDSQGHEGHDDSPPSNNGAPLGDPFFISKQTQFILGISTEVAIDRKLNFTINSTGKIVPSTNGKAEIFSPLPGKIEQSSIPSVGTYVIAGTTLLNIQQTLDIQSKLNIAAEKYKAEEDYAQAKKDYERLSELEGVVAQKEIIAAEIRLNSTQKILSYYESVLAGKSSLNNVFAIKSPVSGIITETNVSLGEQVETTKKLFTIINTNTLWVEAEIYETDVASLQNISHAVVTLQAYPGEYFDASLINVGSVVDDVTRTVKVIFAVQNQNRMLKVGMFASVNVNINSDNNSFVLTVPKESVVDIGGKNVVFVHTKGQTFKGVEVVLGKTDGKYVEILSGIKSGARVVTVGNNQLRSSVK